MFLSHPTRGAVKRIITLQISYLIATASAGTRLALLIRFTIQNFVLAIATQRYQAQTETAFIHFCDHKEISRLPQAFAATVLFLIQRSI